MIIWKNKFVPGWVVLHRKPHPFGNKSHTIFCAVSVVLFFVDLLERKGRPKEIGKREFEVD